MDEFLFGFALGLCIVCFMWAYITHNIHETYIALSLAVVFLFVLLLLGIYQK